MTSDSTPEAAPPSASESLGLPAWRVRRGDGPILAVALHAGHRLRPEIARRIRLSEADRLREEDPYTDLWTDVGDSSVVVERSRFETDLNRPREQAIYRRPEDAWGLDLWPEADGGGLPDDAVERSLAHYDAFYREMRALLTSLAERYGRFVIYDIHSYNHRRDGADEAPADPDGNPELNLGTGTLDRDRWGGVADAFLETVRATPFDAPDRLRDERLDARENVRFEGGGFSRWVHREFPDTGCVLAIELKKFFMDEWTGEPYRDAVTAVREVLLTTVPPVRRALAGVGGA
jgi:N-formylglutamate deformylase